MNDAGKAFVKYQLGMLPEVIKETAAHAVREMRPGETLLIIYKEYGHNVLVTKSDMEINIESFNYPILTISGPTSAD